MPYILITVATFLFAVSAVIQSRVTRGGVSSNAVIGILHLPVGIPLLIWCIFTVDFFQFSLEHFLLLILTGLLWSGAIYFRNSTYRHTDASIVRLFGVLNLCLLLFAGLVLFDEKISVANSLGVLLAILAILLAVDLKSGVSKQALKYVSISSIFFCMAICLVKYLSSRIPVESIVMINFLLPGLTISVLKPSPVSEYIKAANITKNWIVMLPIISFVGYYMSVTAFALGGELIVISVIEQTGLLFILAIEYFLIKTIPNLGKRCFAGSLCTFAAILVTVF